MQLLTLLSLTLTLAFGTQQPSPESILEKGIQSIGGMRAIDSMKSFEMHGVMRLANDTPVLEIELATAEGGKVLGVISFIGLGQSRFGSNGDVAWEQSFQADQSIEWSLIGQQALTQKVQQINWLEWITTLPMHLDSMVVVGKQEFNNEQCWEVVYTTQGNEKESAFFSCDTYRPMGRRTSEKTSSGPSIVDVMFKDWTSVENLLLFKKVIFKRNETEISLAIDTIEIDSVPNGFFNLPHEIRALTPAK